MGTGANAHPKYKQLAVAELAKLTGFPLKPAGNSFEALQSQRAAQTVSSGLKELALELIRIANDLRLLASGPTTGFNEIVLPPVQPGSSIMPGKVNPVMAECLDMVAFQVVGATQLFLCGSSGADGAKRYDARHNVQHAVLHPNPKQLHPSFHRKMRQRNNRQREAMQPILGEKPVAWPRCFHPTSATWKRQKSPSKPKRKPHGKRYCVGKGLLNPGNRENIQPKKPAKRTITNLFPRLSFSSHKISSRPYRVQLDIQKEANL